MKASLRWSVNVIVLLLLGAPVVHAGTPVQERELPLTDDGQPIVARVNGEPILLEDFEREQRYSGHSPAEIMDALIERAVVEQKIAELGLTISDDRVTEVIQQHVEDFYPAQPPDIDNGAAIYAANCTACHGETGTGDGPLVQSGQVQAPLSLHDPEISALYPFSYWQQVILDGRLENLMPPWRDTLGEQGVWDVAFYTYTLHRPADITAGSSEDTRLWRSWLAEHAEDRDVTAYWLLYYDVIVSYRPEPGSLQPTYHVQYLRLNTAEDAHIAMVRLERGESVSALAAEYMPDVANQGDAGWVTEGALRSSLLEAQLLAMQPGEVAGPVHMGDWYFVLYLVEQDAAAVDSQMADDMGYGRFGVWLRQAVIDADVEIYNEVDWMVFDELAWVRTFQLAERP